LEIGPVATADVSSEDGQEPDSDDIPAAEDGRKNHASYSHKELQRFCEVRSLVISDLNAQRGNIWVRTDQSDDFVNEQLLEWGFQYRPNRGWWRETPNMIE
jgi:N6-adenosine-specific RNA methylase IME4